MSQAPDTDTIVDEIHRTRRQICEKFHGDIAAILADARVRQAAAGRPVWQRKSSDEAPRLGDRRSDSRMSETTPAAG
jgi:hypothetical protein